MTATKAVPKDPRSRVMHAAKIALAMRENGLPSTFILNIFLLVTQDSRSAYDLMALWEDAGESKEERDETVADMQELLDDIENRVQKTQKPYIAFDKLVDVGGKVMAYKAKLRDIIDRNGGVSRVAELSGIPQPSLSRMLGSASMPRRTTLYKIANALQLPETDIVTDFSR